MASRAQRDLARLIECSVDRRRLLRWSAAGAGAATLAPHLVGAQGTPAGQATVTGGEVQMHWATEGYDTLNPLISTDGNEQQVMRLIFGALVKMNDQPAPVSDLAETIDVSEDASTYTFTLRENITFSDGTPLTSDDVRFTIERAIDKRTGSYWQGRLLGIVGAAEYSENPTGSVAGIETPDERTITFTLDPPDSAFLVLLGDFAGLGILPKHVLQDVAPGDLAEHPFSREPTVSAGAFKFVRYETEQYMELARNDTYWGEPPPLDRIFLRIMTPEVALAELEAGTLDLTQASIGEIERLGELPDITVQSVESPSMNFLAINMGREFLQDKRLHQAMMYATNRQGIVGSLFQGQATVVSQPVMYGPDWMGEISAELNPYEYDPDRARQLLDEIGWDANQAVTISFPNEAVQIEKDFLAIIREQWREVGIAAKLLGRPSFEPLTQTQDFDLFLVGGGVFRVDPSVSARFLTTPNFTPAGGNFGHYSNPEVDELFVQARATGDPVARKQIYDQIALILNDELPWIFLWSPNSHYGVRNRLVGFQAPGYSDNELWNAETWSVTE